MCPTHPTDWSPSSPRGNFPSLRKTSRGHSLIWVFLRNILSCLLCHSKWLWLSWPTMATKCSPLAQEAAEMGQCNATSIRDMETKMSSVTCPIGSTGIQTQEDQCCLCSGRAGDGSEDMESGVLILAAASGELLTMQPFSPAQSDLGPFSKSPVFQEEQKSACCPEGKTQAVNVRSSLPLHHVFGLILFLYKAFFFFFPQNNKDSW